MNKKVATYKFHDLRVGQEASFDFSFSEDDLDQFAKLTGDVSPIHMSDDVSQSRGYSQRVVHGILLGGAVSQLVGVHLPGKNALLQSCKLKFHDVVYPNTPLTITGMIDSISDAVRTIVIKFIIESGNTKKCSGQVQILVAETE